MLNLDIVIDGRALVGNRTGIGVHPAESARRLAVAPPPLIATHAEIVDRSGIEGCRFRVDRAHNGIVWQQTRLARIPADVLWAPHGTLPLALKSPAVITLHDFTSITMPRRHRAKTVLSFNLFIGRSLQRATKIACVSRAVADQAIRSFAVSPAKIAIVPNGVDAFYSPGGNEGDYILYAGTIEPRKGIDDLMAVWRALPEPRPRLVLCGARGWGAIDVAGAEVTGYLARERLRELYRGALAFVYPSRAEGFGMPPLEAMACGAPVLATRAGAIPEYADGAALLVDPGDRPALSESLRRLLRDPALRSDLRVWAAERAGRYRWDGSAATMTELFAEATR
jgi:glycosyltransferase involved in cell wall biosynthesis